MGSPDLPTALDLARLVVALDDRMTWPANAWKYADALRAAAHAVLTATGHADEIPEDPYADEDDRNPTTLEISDGTCDGLDPTHATDADWANFVTSHAGGPEPTEKYGWVGWPNSVWQRVA